MDGKISILVGDITTIKTDAIVNAAKNTLLGGGGVDGAIHRAAGPGLLEECRGIGGCPTGEARVSRAFDLPAKWVIHTVGPVWRDGENGEESMLRSAYANSLREALEAGARRVSFPAISTGAYGYPRDKAARVAVAAIKSFLREHAGDFDEILLVCFSESSAEAHRKAMEELS